MPGVLPRSSSNEIH